MDYLELGIKKFIVISHGDCVDMAYLGYDCFNLIFTEDDWNRIVEFPNDGLYFFHFDPTAHKFIELATDSDLQYDQRYDNLISLRQKYELVMLEFEVPFPNEWDFDVI